MDVGGGVVRETSSGGDDLHHWFGGRIKEITLSGWDGKMDRNRRDSDN